MRNFCVNMKRRFISLGLTTAILGTAAIGIMALRKKDMPNKEKINMICEYYGDISDEDKILEYLEYVNTIENFKFTNEKINIDNEELKSPKEIAYLIYKYERLKNNFNNIEDILDIVNELKVQKELMSNYLKDNGHDFIYKKFTTTLKEFVKSTYNLEDCYELELFKKKNIDLDTYYVGEYNHYYNPAEYIEETFKIDDEISIDGILTMIKLQEVEGKDYKEKLAIYSDALKKVMEYNNALTTQKSFKK